MTGYYGCDCLLRLLNDQFSYKRFAQWVGLWENARRYILGMGFFWFTRNHAPPEEVKHFQ
ncbi:uncharacterized protein MP3633_3398 [Marinomonas primoryensis]|uniref:Uncharacterized protein n=1 Tax=Marinomonas primoryensis TaxID=178399 RepID=A0A859CZK6_9GAMM|nr:uncharacterized protein MP3633_3398 [Marinomonas primoryensis]